jgi:hypothetical protein
LFFFFHGYGHVDLLTNSFLPNVYRQRWKDASLRKTRYSQYKQCNQHPRTYRTCVI